MKFYKKNITFFNSLFIILSSCGLYAQNAAPVLSATGNQVYCPGTSLNIVTSMSITDTDDTSIEAIYIQISSGYVNGQDILTLTGTHPTVTSSWDANGGKLTLKSPVAIPVSYTDFIDAIEDVVYSNNSALPSGSRDFSITVGQANYLPSTGHYYEFSPALAITWTNANSAAQSSSYYGLQGYLATITSAEEAQLSGEQASGAGWIGGSDAETEGVWKWVTGPEAGTIFWNGGPGGTTPNFAFWNSNEPNNLGNENYAHVTAPGVGTPGSWNDLSNTGDITGGAYQPKGFILEYGGMPGDPTLHISTSTTITIPQISSTTAASICGPGSVTLNAAATGGTIKWYDNSTGGTLLFTGPSFTTPVLNTTTTYYADAAEAGCTTSTRTAVTATVNDIPNLIATAPAPACEGSVTLNASVDIGQIRWYDQQTGGTLLQTGNAFITPHLTGNTTYYVEALNNGCYSGPRVAVNVIINPKPIVNDETQSICENGQTTLDAAITNVTYLWSTGAATRQITITDPGLYTVEVTNANHCSSVKTFTVTEKTAPIITDVIVDNNTVTINVLNPGEFEYSVDGTSFQSSNIFIVDNPGINRASVRQIDGCGSDFRDFIIIIIPNFFTPNNDSTNDLWTVKGMVLYPNASVSIFDRYGKLITRLSRANLSWNGTLDGRPLPSTDYWYVLKIDETSPEVRGHFSLVR